MFIVQLLFIFPQLYIVAMGYRKESNRTMFIVYLFFLLLSSSYHYDNGWQGRIQTHVYLLFTSLRLLPQWTTENNPVEQCLSFILLFFTSLQLVGQWATGNNAVKQYLSFIHSLFTFPQLLRQWATGKNPDEQKDEERPDSFLEKFAMSNQQGQGDTGPKWTDPKWVLRVHS